MRGKVQYGIGAAALAALCLFHICIARCGAPVYGGVLSAAAAAVLVVLPGLLFADLTAAGKGPLWLTRTLVGGVALFAAASVAAAWSGLRFLVFAPAALSVWYAVRRKGKKANIASLRGWAVPLCVWLMAWTDWFTCPRSAPSGSSIPA